MTHPAAVTPAVLQSEGLAEDQAHAQLAAGWADGAAAR
jgi:hypothetical protein